MEDGFEIAFKCGETAASEVGEAVEGDVEFVVFVHVGFQVDFAWFAEIEEGVFEGGIGFEQEYDGFFDFEVGEDGVVGACAVYVWCQRFDVVAE